MFIYVQINKTIDSQNKRRLLTINCIKNYIVIKKYKSNMLICFHKDWHSHEW